MLKAKIIKQPNALRHLKGKIITLLREIKLSKAKLPDPITLRLDIKIKPLIKHGKSTF